MNTLRTRRNPATTTRNELRRNPANPANTHRLTKGGPASPQRGALVTQCGHTGMLVDFWSASHLPVRGFSETLRGSDGIITKNPADSSPWGATDSRFLRGLRGFFGANARTRTHARVHTRTRARLRAPNNTANPANDLQTLGAQRFELAGFCWRNTATLGKTPQTLKRRCTGQNMWPPDHDATDQFHKNPAEGRRTCR
jgi:hypothetical protein